MTDTKLSFWQSLILTPGIISLFSALSTFPDIVIFWEKIYKGKSTTNSRKRILLFSFLQFVTINSEVLYSLRVDFFENLVTIITLWILVKISSFIYNTLFCEVSLAIAGIQEP